MANSVTITAKAGPAIQDTAVVITNVSKLDYNYGSNTIAVFVPTTPSPLIFDASAVTNVATTVSGGNWTVVIT